MQKQWNIVSIEKRLHSLLLQDKDDTEEYKNLLRRLRTETSIHTKKVIEEVKLRRRLSDIRLVHEKLPPIKPAMSRQEELDKINSFINEGRMEVLDGDC